MSQPPLSYQSTTIRPASPNVLAIIGFILAMLGLSGFCAPPAFAFGLIGALLCAIALFRRPRGLAIAGLVVGVLELLAALSFLVVVGIYYGSKARTAMQDAQFATSVDHAREIAFAIDRYRNEHHALPPTLNDLPPLGADAMDGLGNPIRYVPNLEQQTYRLMSDCWDGKPNTADDATLMDTSIKPQSRIKIPTIPRTPMSPAEHAARQQAITSYDAMLSDLATQIEELKSSKADAAEIADITRRMETIRAERDRLLAVEAASTRPTP